MAKFPKGLLLVAAAMELMILTVSGHGASVRAQAPLPMVSPSVAGAKVASASTSGGNESVFGLVRRDPATLGPAPTQPQSQPKHQTKTNTGNKTNKK